MKGPKMGLTGGIINKVRYVPLLTDPKVSHGQLLQTKRRLESASLDPDVSMLSW